VAASGWLRDPEHSEERLELGCHHRLEVAFGIGLQRLVKPPAKETRRLAKAGALEAVIADPLSGLRLYRFGPRLTLTR
jgi:hypothetical protein